jgi:hypothetical protein
MATVAAAVRRQIAITLLSHPSKQTPQCSDARAAKGLMAVMAGAAGGNEQQETNP